MKKLYLVGGPMGVGKTAACRALQARLDSCVFLDGDWCWDMRPFQVTEETKTMVLDNICHLLNNFLRCSAYENVIFCWVMHEQDIIDRILSRLDTADCEIVAVSLVCGRKTLAGRLQKDIDRGLRTADVIPRSLERLACYGALDTVRLDTTDMTPEETAEAIRRL